MSIQLGYGVAVLNQNRQARVSSGRISRRSRFDHRIEPLESRCLLSAAVDSAAAGLYGPTITGKGGMLAKVDTSLDSLSKEYTASGGSSLAFHTRETTLRTTGNTVSIEAFAQPGLGAQLESQLVSLGLSNVQVHGG